MKRERLWKSWLRVVNMMLRNGYGVGMIWLKMNALELQVGFYV